MTDPSVWLFVTFLILVGLGVPIAIAVGVSGAAFLWYYQLGIQILSANIYGNIAKFQLLAIPFFILAGLILDRVGISQRLVHLVNLLIGPTTGGLALVAVVVCVFFAGISGSGPADTAALGTVLIPAMVAKGYDTGFASALIASGAASPSSSRPASPSSSTASSRPPPSRRCSRPGSFRGSWWASP